MALVLKNNMPAKNTLNVLDKNDKMLAKSLKKAASGLRINGADDDASGYAISERMEVQMRGLNQDVDNTQTGNAMLKVAEGGVQSSVEILKTLKEKAINAANDTNTNADRATMQKEFDQSIDQLDENATVTYNGKTMLDGSKNNEVVGEQGRGTQNVLVNEKFSADTTARTRIYDLKDFSGRPLNITSDSSIEISYVKQGKTYTRMLDPVERHRIQEIFAASTDTSGNNIMASTIAGVSIGSTVGPDRTGKEVTTASGNVGFFFRSAEVGVNGQIAGLTFLVRDHDGTINRTATNVFNDINEIIRAEDPSPDNALVFQTGTKANDAVKIGFSDLRPVALGLRGTDGSTIQITTQKAANAAISAVDLALSKVLDQQTSIGAVRNRLDYTGDTLTTNSENTQKSMSTIRDADMAATMTQYTKTNILTQSAQAMLAQANQNASSVLSLLQ